MVHRRKALLQTARIVFGASAFACSSTPASSTAPAPLPTPDPTPAQTRSRTPPQHDANLCTIEVDADGALVERSLECCLAATTAETADGGAKKSDFEPCCRALSTKSYVSLVYGEHHWPYTACYACETVVKNTNCTPWGPPMPPPMA